MFRFDIPTLLLDFMVKHQNLSHRLSKKQNEDHDQTQQTAVIILFIIERLQLCARSRKLLKKLNHEAMEYSFFCEVFFHSYSTGTAALALGNMALINNIKGEIEVKIFTIIVDNPTKLYHSYIYIIIIN